MNAQVQRQLFAKTMRRRTGVSQPVWHLLGRWTMLLRQWRDSTAAAADFQVPHFMFVQCSARESCDMYFELIHSWRGKT